MTISKPVQCPVGERDGCELTKLLRVMKDGDMIEVSDYRSAQTVALNWGFRNGVRIVTRKIHDKGVRIWRVGVKTEFKSKRGANGGVNL